MNKYTNYKSEYKQRKNSAYELTTLMTIIKVFSNRSQMTTHINKDSPISDATVVFDIELSVYNFTKDILRYFQVSENKRNDIINCFCFFVFFAVVTNK